MSTLKVKTRPELASRAYTLEEETWLKVIAESYPKWDQPYLIQDFNANNPVRGIKTRYSPKSASTSPIQVPPRLLKSAKKNKITKKKVHKINSNKALQYQNETKDNLPAIIIDDLNQKTSPAANHSFKIVPENESLPNTPPPTNPHLQRYTVSKGETLMEIARKFYGDESAWKRIYNLNKEVLENHPDRIQPGMILVIP